MNNFFFLYGYHSRLDVRVVAAQHGGAVRVCGHVRDPEEALPLKISGEAVARYDHLLPVARREGCVRRQKDKAFAVSDHNRRLALRMAGHIDQLNALIPEQVDDPVIRSERRTTVKRALHGVLETGAPWGIGSRDPAAAGSCTRCGRTNSIRIPAGRCA